MGLRDWHVRRGVQRWIAFVVICTAQLQIITEVRFLGVLQDCEEIGVEFLRLSCYSYWYFRLLAIWVFLKNMSNFGMTKNDKKNIAKHASKLSLDFYWLYKSINPASSGARWQSYSVSVPPCYVSKCQVSSGSKEAQKSSWVLFLSLTKSRMVRKSSNMLQTGLEAL